MNRETEHSVVKLNLRKLILLYNEMETIADVNYSRLITFQTEFEHCQNWPWTAGYINHYLSKCYELFISIAINNLHYHNNNGNHIKNP